MPPTPERSSSHPYLASEHDSFPEAVDYEYYYDAFKTRKSVSEKSVHAHAPPSPTQSARSNHNNDDKVRSVSAPPKPFQEKWTDERIDSIMLMQHSNNNCSTSVSHHHDDDVSSTVVLLESFPLLWAALLADPERSLGIGNEQQRAVPERDAVASPFAWRDDYSSSASAAAAAFAATKIRTATTTRAAAAGNGDETIAALQARGVRGGGLVRAAAAASTVQVIRPQPVKTTAPTGASGTLLVAPQARTAARSIEEDHGFGNKIIEEESGVLQSTTTTTTATAEDQGVIQQQEENKINNSLPLDSKKPPPPQPPPPEPWCKQATDQSKNEEEQLQRKQKQAEERQRKLQQLQTDFPSSSKDFPQDTTTTSTKMPPTSGEGQPHGQNNGEVHENTPQAARRDNRQQQHRHHHRSTPAAAAVAGTGVRTARGGGGGGDHHGSSTAAAAARRATEDEDGIAAAKTAAATTKTSIHPPTPLFERLVTEEVQELKAYARIIESQNRRLAELEHAHGDLETRLQVESKSRQKLEATLESREREWSYRLEQLESDRDHWKKRVNEEQTKNDRLMEEIMRKEQEIRRMLQRKYDNETSRSVRGSRGMPSERPERSHHAATSRSPELHRANFQSPHEILRESGSADMARLRNTRSLLLDFFGM